MGEDRHKQSLAFSVAATVGLMLFCYASGFGHPHTPGWTPMSSIVSGSTTSTSSQALSGEWRFAIDPSAIGRTAGWFKPSFDDASWATVTVPHTWNVMPDYADYAGLAWYRRRFAAPATARDMHLRLRFEAVFYLAHVWLNGIYLGVHEGGYTPFEFDVTEIVNAGAENLIAVQVDNRRATDRIPATLYAGWSYDWWNYGGIVRDVELYLSGRAFIAQQRVIAVPHLVAAHQADRATITVTVGLRNALSHAIDGVLSGDVLDDATGHSALSSQPSLSVTLPPGERLDVQLATTVPQPTLWHFDRPHLYRWSAALRTADGAVLHTADVQFGIRSVALKDARLYFNGEPVRLVGLTRHADSPEHGLAEPLTVMAADYADLKTLNTVLTRPVHYPQAKFIMEYADRAGILFIPEVPVWQLTAKQMANPHIRALVRQQLREMITAHWNHPSVFAWSVGNEVQSKTPAGHEFIRDMIAYVKSLDPTRPVGFASNRLDRHPETDATAFADFVMMNQYFGTWGGPKDELSAALDAIHAAWPDKPIIISEYGFEPRWQRLRKRPILRRSQYYLLPEDVAADSEAADVLRRQLIVDQMAVMRQKPFLAGAIFWTYQDYRTPTDYKMGVVDAQRRRRGSWRTLRDEYAPVLIDSVSVSPPAESVQHAVVVLRARGPIERDMPAYTLRGYRLHWTVAGKKDGRIVSEGELALPMLAPGTTWSARVEWPVPTQDYLLTFRLLRPAGFMVLERVYDAQGNPLP